MSTKFRYHHKEDGWCEIDFNEDNIAKGFEGYEYRPHCSRLFQFTGLKDKFGIDIWEGSIMQHENIESWYGNKTTVVIFNPKKARFEVTNSIGFNHKDIVQQIRSDIVVIGDIIKNPELLTC